MILKNMQYLQENTSGRIYFLNKVARLRLQIYEKETLTEALSCEFRKIFKNICFTKHLRATASDSFFFNKYILILFSSFPHFFPRGNANHGFPFCNSNLTPFSITVDVYIHNKKNNH